MFENNSAELLKELLSKDPQRIWSATSKIGKFSQDEDIINDLIEHYDDIKEVVNGVELGGMLASNQRFVDKMFEIIDHYKRNV